MRAMRPVARSRACCGRRVSALKSVETANHALVTELLVEHERCVGVRFYDQLGFPRDARAKATLLATGGAGQVFRHTTNPRVATGDGVALGFHAGARVADLEFVQFHPTALNVPGAPRFLISEALRGDGGRLINGRGQAFMTRYHPDGDLAPRDVVARGIVREMDTTGGSVFLSLSHLDSDYVVRRFPTIADMCRQVGLDLARDPIPVSPAAHYVMGGVDDRSVGQHVAAGIARGRRGRVHGRPRREPAGQQLAARGARLRRPRGVGDAAAGGRRASRKRSTRGSPPRRRPASAARR